MMGGLPAPRSPAEIVNGTVMNREGVSVDRAFRLGAERALELAKREQPDLIVLQPRSPSCGVNEIYDGTFSSTLIPGQGVFAELLKKNNIKAIDVADIR